MDSEKGFFVVNKNLPGLAFFGTKVLLNDSQLDTLAKAAASILFFLCHSLTAAPASKAKRLCIGSFLLGWHIKKKTLPWPACFDWRSEGPVYGETLRKLLKNVAYNFCFFRTVYFSS